MVGSSDGIDGKTYSIKKIVEHPDSDEYSYSYNYALIKVKGTFTWSDKVANVSLPSAEPEAKTSFVVAGYGDSVSRLYLPTFTYSKLPQGHFLTKVSRLHLDLCKLRGGKGMNLKSA